MITLILQVLELGDSYECWNKAGKAKKLADTIKRELNGKAKKKLMNGNYEQENGIEQSEHARKVLQDASKSSKKKFLELRLTRNKLKGWKTDC